MEPAARRRQVILAGHSADSELVMRHLDDPSASVREAALGALRRCRTLSTEILQAALSDEDTGVRQRACELAASDPAVDLTVALGDSEASVVEVAAWSCGEQGGSDQVELLSSVARTHADALCREAAVAALGAIGDATGLPVILAATTDKATVRRRAVIALAPFEGPEVDTALRKALDDRDWQVRQAAEELNENRSP
jgi:HEAT repeat protein